MSEITKIVLTAGATTVLGVFAFVIGQIIQRLFIEPAHELRKTLGRVAHAETFYANVTPRQALMFGGGECGMTVEELTQVSRELRTLAADLRAHLFALPAYGLMSPVFRLPSRAKVLTIATSLIGWSNSVYDTKGSRTDRRKVIAEALQLRNCD
jgi:hypothetical protein